MLQTDTSISIYGLPSRSCKWPVFGLQNQFTKPPSAMNKVGPKAFIIERSRLRQGIEMKVEAQLMNEQGRSISSIDRTRMPKYRGELRIREARSQAFGRIVTMAELISSTDGLEGSVLPSLHDAFLIYLSSGTMRIRGFEVINGTQYGQTWDMKVS